MHGETMKLFIIIIIIIKGETTICSLSRLF